MACKWYSVCPLRRWENNGVISHEWKEEYCSSETNWNNCKRYYMEEQGIPHDKVLPDGSSLSGDNY